MFILPRLFSAAVLGFVVTWQAAIAEDAMTQKQRYAEAMSFQASAPEQTIEKLRILSEEGYSRATDRLAYFTFKGVAVPQDTEVAISLYRQAAANGRTSSLVSLGKVYLTIRDHENAAATLKEASESGHAKADAILAWAHATKRLGDLSEVKPGLSQLNELAHSGSRDAAMYLLDASVRNKMTPDNISPVLDHLHELQADGDAKAAESLLRFYRARSHPRGTLKMRAMLIETDGIRDKIRIEEGLYLARDQKPAQFWTLSEGLVQSAPDEVYARALSVAARINKNAYVRIVQKELRTHGYSVGRASPYLNAPLIRSINKFCRDTGMKATCAPGPLKSVTIKAVAGKLAEMRSTS